MVHKTFLPSANILEHARSSSFSEHSALLNKHGARALPGHVVINGHPRDEDVINTDMNFKRVQSPQHPDCSRGVMPVGATMFVPIDLKMTISGEEASTLESCAR